MDKNTIIFNYNNAIKQADEIDSIVKELRKIPEEALPQSVSSIKAAWVGTNSDSYVAKVKKLISKTNTTVASLSKASSTIRQIAKNIYDAEMEAIRIAEERSAK